MYEDPNAFFENWLPGEAPDYPLIEDGGTERIYIRATEARDLLRRAYVAGWNQATEVMRDRLH
jgi:hypothetical protein